MNGGALFFTCFLSRLRSTALPLSKPNSVSLQVPECPLAEMLLHHKKEGTAIRLSGNDCQRDGRSGLLFSALSLFLLEPFAAGILAGPSEKGPDGGGAMRRAALSVRVSGGERGRGSPRRRNPGERRNSGENPGEGRNLWGWESAGRILERSGGFMDAGGSRKICGGVNRQKGGIPGSGGQYLLPLGIPGAYSLFPHSFSRRNDKNRGKKACLDRYRREGWKDRTR